MILNSVEQAWYNSLTNKAATFRAFVESESQAYQKFLDNEVNNSDKL
jgi:hypothetical protein